MNKRVSHHENIKLTGKQKAAAKEPLLHHHPFMTLEIALHIAISYMTALHFFNTEPAAQKSEPLTASANSPFFNLRWISRSSEGILMVFAPLSLLLIEVKQYKIMN